MTPFQQGISLFTAGATPLLITLVVWVGKIQQQEQEEK